VFTLDQIRSTGGTAVAVEQTPRGPRDTHAERATLAAGIWLPEWWAAARHYVTPDQFDWPEHQRIAHALDQLDDLPLIIPDHIPSYERPDFLWPDNLTVRVNAVATIADLNPAPVRAVAAYADGRHLQTACQVAQHHATRARIFELRLEAWKLAQ
jgi:hypothetical protein